MKTFGFSSLNIKKVSTATKEKVFISETATLLEHVYFHILSFNKLD